MPSCAYQGSNVLGTKIGENKDQAISSSSVVDVHPRTGLATEFNIGGKSGVKIRLDGTVPMGS